MRSLQLILIVLVLGFGFLLAARPPILRIPIVGELGGQRINTVVDSELAKYYLENYLANKRTNPELDSLITKIHQHADSLSLPTYDYLKHLANAYSVDFAALYLAKRILDNQTNLPMQRAYRKEFLKLNGAATLQPHPDFSSYVIFFVPGWVYKSHTETGADLAKPRKIIAKIGIENHFIEIEQSGTIEKNAAFIAQEIVRYNRPDKKIILVSASSGGASVALTLGQLLRSDETLQIAAWLNIGGLLHGSSLADAAIRGPKRWLTKIIITFNGWDLNSIESMTTRRSRARLSQIHLPKHILVINYVGIPLSGDVTKLAKDGYNDLRREGPNDGLTLITDEIFPEGITIVELGLDHYFQDKEIDLKTAALTQTIITHLESQREDGFEKSAKPIDVKER